MKGRTGPIGVINHMTGIGSSEDDDEVLSKVQANPKGSGVSKNEDFKDSALIMLLGVSQVRTTAENRSLVGISEKLMEHYH